jgi:hypothetical protein
METTYHIIRANGSPIEVVTINLPEDPGYVALRDIVRPVIGERRDMERVAVLYEDRPTDMFVDDVGALCQMPVNARASAIYRANWLKQHPGTDPDSLPAIHGDAVLFLRRVWF